MTKCQYVWEDEKAKKILCTVCGHTRYTVMDDITQIYRKCTTPVEFQAAKPVPPPIITRIKNFSKAAIAHLTAGMPTCTQEEINERFAICKECPLFIKNGEEAGVCSHKSCGCNLNLEMVFLNKLGWRREKCPLDKWGPIPE